MHHSIHTPILRRIILRCAKPDSKLRLVCRRWNQEINTYYKCLVRTYGLDRILRWFLLDLPNAPAESIEVVNIATNVWYGISHSNIHKSYANNESPASVFLRNIVYEGGRTDDKRFTNMLSLDDEEHARDIKYIMSLSVADNNYLQQKAKTLQLSTIRALDFDHRIAEGIQKFLRPRKRGQSLQQQDTTLSKSLCISSNYSSWIGRSRHNISIMLDKEILLLSRSDQYSAQYLPYDIPLLQTTWGMMSSWSEIGIEATGASQYCVPPFSYDVDLPRRQNNALQNIVGRMCTRAHSKRKLCADKRPLKAPWTRAYCKRNKIMI